MSIGSLFPDWGHIGGVVLPSAEPQEIRDILWTIGPKVEVSWRILEIYLDTIIDIYSWVISPPGSEKAGAVC